MMELRNRLELIIFSKKIVNLASSKNIDLRIFGSIAVDILCEFNDENNVNMKDVDFVAKEEQMPQVLKFFNDIGFSNNNPIYTENGWHYNFNSRENLYKNSLHLDVYFGELTFNHKIPPPYFDDNYKFTIPVSTLLLSKLAIVEITEKDKNAIYKILFTFEISNNDKLNSIHLKYFAEVWSAGWHGWELAKTCSINISNLKKEIVLLDDSKEEYKQRIIRNLNKLQSIMNRVKKNCCWNTRNYIGDKKKHYKDSN